LQSEGENGPSKHLVAPCAAWSYDRSKGSGGPDLIEVDKMVFSRTPTQKGRGSRMARTLTALGGSLLLATAGLAVVSNPASATITFTVNTTQDGADSNVGDGVCADTTLEGNQCTLRAAIQEADATPGGAIVSVPAGTYTLTLNPGLDDLTESNGASGDLNITPLGSGSGNVTIQGAGQGSTIINTNWGTGTVDRVINVGSEATANISGITVTGGDLIGSTGCGFEGLPRADGAGILNLGRLTLSNSTVTANTNNTTTSGSVSRGSGGGVAAFGSSASTTLTGDTISSNTTNGDGGGVVSDFCGSTAGNTATISISGSTISGNTAGHNGGGANELIGILTITGSTLSNNHAVGDSGGVSEDGGGTVSVTGSTLSGNSASGDGGGTGNNGGGAVNLTASTISGNSANGDGGGIGEDGGDTVTISNSTISNNRATNDGGGIGTDGGGTFNVSGTSITGNTAFSGGGVSDDGGDTLTFDSSTISNNLSGGFGGGFIGFGGGGSYTITNSTIDSNKTRSGGGIDTEFDAWVVAGTTISNNQANAAFVLPDIRTGDTTPSTHPHVRQQPHSTGELGEGGAVYNDSCDVVSFTNDTLVNNSSSGPGGGYITDFCSGGLVRHAVVKHAPLTGQSFLNDTIAGNTAGSGAGDFEQNDAAHVSMTQSIVANGSPVSCLVNNAATFISGGHNLFSGPVCGTAGTGDIPNTDPMLGALGNNGGPTLTELPATGSVAIGGIPAGSCPPPSTDQRGVARPQGTGGTCTIGAVEVVGQSVNPNGYRMGAIEGGVFDFGINFDGSLANAHLNAPIVGIANQPGPNGYLLVGADGGVFALGGAPYLGSLGGHMLPAPIAAIAATPNGLGYWLAGQTGIVYSFGNAPSLPAVEVPIGTHIVGIASTPDGQGVWLTDTRGDIYTLGDAQYLGSLGGHHLNAPITSIAPAANGPGYVLAGADGGVFTFGIGFYGSAARLHLVGPIVGIAVTHSGHGYWLVGSDGGVFCFGDAPFLGSTYTQLKAGQHLNGPIVAIQHLGNGTT
jgi:CSLREA domain-containing protein